jgi:hypothetical protein
VLTLELPVAEGKSEFWTLTIEGSKDDLRLISDQGDASPVVFLSTDCAE